MYSNVQTLEEWLQWESPRLMYRRGVLKTWSHLRLEYEGDGLDLTPPVFDNNKSRSNSDSTTTSPKPPKRPVSWLRQLYDVLQHPDPRVSSMLAWSACGSAFGIHERFIDELCGDGKPFIASNLKSFRRRLTKYGLFVSPSAPPQRGRAVGGGGYIAFYTKEGLHRELTWENFAEVLKHTQQMNHEQERPFSASADSMNPEDSISLASQDGDIPTPKRKRDELVDGPNASNIHSMHAKCNDVTLETPEVNELTRARDEADDNLGCEQGASTPKRTARNDNERSAAVTTPPLPQAVVKMVSSEPPITLRNDGNEEERTFCALRDVTKSTDQDFDKTGITANGSDRAPRSASRRSARGQAESRDQAGKNTYHGRSSSSSASEEPCASISDNTTCGEGNGSSSSSNLSLCLGVNDDELKRMARAGGVTVRSLERNQIDDPTDRFREPRENSRGASAASGLSAGGAQDRDPLNGRRVQIFWPTIHEWFEGTLHAVGATSSLHGPASKAPLDLQRGGDKYRVAYDDGDEEVVSEAYLRLHKNVYLYPYTPTAKELEAKAAAEAKAKADQEAAIIAAENAKEEAAEKAAAEKAAAATAKIVRKKAVMAERGNKRSPVSKSDNLAASASAANQESDHDGESSSDSDSSDEDSDNESNALDATGYAALTFDSGDTSDDFNLVDDSAGQDEGGGHGTRSGANSNSSQSGCADNSDVLGPGGQVWFSPRRRRWVARVAWRGAYVTLAHSFTRRHALAVLKRARELVPLAVKEANALAAQAVPLTAVSAAPSAAAPAAPMETGLVQATPAPAAAAAAAAETTVAEFVAPTAVAPAANANAAESAQEEIPEAESAADASNNAQVSSLSKRLVTSPDETSTPSHTSTNGNDDVTDDTENPIKRPRTEPSGIDGDTGATIRERLDSTTLTEKPTTAPLEKASPIGSTSSSSSSSSSSPSLSATSPSSKLIVRSGRLAGLPPEIDPDKAENEQAKIAKAEAEALAVLKAEAKAAKRNGDSHVKVNDNGNGHENGNISSNTSSLSSPAPVLSADASSSSSTDTLAPVVATLLPSPPLWLSTMLASTAALDAHFDAAVRIATRADRAKPQASIQNLLKGRNSYSNSNGSTSSSSCAGSRSGGNSGNGGSSGGNSGNNGSRMTSSGSSSGAVSMDLDGKAQCEPEDPFLDDDFSDEESDDDRGVDARRSSSPNTNETRRSPLVYRKKMAMPERVKVDETFAHALDGMMNYQLFELLIRSFFSISLLIR